LTYRVAFTPKSRTELRAIIRYITKKSSARIANEYAAAIVAHCESLQTFPNRGTARPDLFPGVRTMGFRDRVTIPFRVSDEQQLVSILGIFYGGRSVEQSFLQNG